MIATDRGVCLLVAIVLLGHAAVAQARATATLAGDCEPAWELLERAADLERALLNFESDALVVLAMAGGS